MATKFCDEELLLLAVDPGTPHWADELIRECLNRDPVDVANVLEQVAALFRRRADGMTARVGNEATSPCGWCIAEAGHEMPEGVAMENCEHHSQ